MDDLVSSLEKEKNFDGIEVMDGLRHQVSLELHEDDSDWCSCSRGHGGGGMRT